MDRKILVQGDFSDLACGDRITTDAIKGYRADGSVSTLAIPGVIVGLSDAGALIVQPHLGLFSYVANRAAITFVERGGPSALYHALLEAADRVAPREARRGS